MFFFNASCWFRVCSSRPEDRGHQEEAAAVHRAVQVAPQLAEPLVRLRHAGLSRPDQPGQRSNTHEAGWPLWIRFFFMVLKLGEATWGVTVRLNVELVRHHPSVLHRTTVDCV